MAITLTNIPRIMRHHHWDNGARLMDIWFAGAPATAPAFGPPDTGTIRMDSWVLTFPRVRLVYDQLMMNQIWKTPAARAQLATVLARTGMAGVSGRFGNLSRPVTAINADAVNYQSYGGGGDLDDMAAALNRFIFKVALAGEVTASPGRTVVSVHEVGVFVRDSYDFEGRQFLGFWNETTNDVSMSNPLAGDWVDNGAFRDWRTANGRGGDFEVFSDVKRVSISDTFTVP